MLNGTSPVRSVCPPDVLWRLPLWHMFFLLVILLPAYGFAQSYDCVGPNSTTTLPSGAAPLVSQMMSNVVQFLNTMGVNVYNAIMNSPFFSLAAQGLVTLFVVIFGINIIFDLENLTPANVLGKTFKLGLIWWLIGSGGWDVFQRYIGGFFWGTMFEIIELMTGSAVSNMAGMTYNAAALAAPLHVLDGPLQGVLSRHFMITIMGSIPTGPQGFVLGIALIWGGAQVVVAIMTAVFTYVKTIIGMWFLFSLGPIFIACMLFNRTQKIFQGWLSKILGFALEGIMLFVFLAFFMSMITDALEPVLGITWCWVPYWNIIPGVLSFDIYWWGAHIVPGSGFPGDVLPDYGTRSWRTADGYDGSGLMSPVATLDVFFLILVAHIAWQYSAFTTLMAETLSQGGMRIGATYSDAQEYIKAKGLTPGQIAGKGFQIGKKAFG